MTVRELAIDGAVLVEGQRFPDERGEFRRLTPLETLAAAGMELETSYVACAHNVLAGTVRGLHYQIAPHLETKALWCHAGSLFDVLVDTRADSPTFGQWTSIDLSASRPEVVVVPAGVAHGYQTTSGNTGVTYVISGRYAPESGRTIHWQDSTLAIAWPLAGATVSDADASAPNWQQVS